MNYRCNSEGMKNISVVILSERILKSVADLEGGVPHNILPVIPAGDPRATRESRDLAMGQPRAWALRKPEVGLHLLSELCRQLKVVVG